MNRFAPTPIGRPSSPRRTVAPRPAWVHGGRDWTIYIECRANDLVLYPSADVYSIADAARTSADNPLLVAIQKMIDAQQSLRRPGEPPYHPQLCLLVRPQSLRAFLNVYPALDTLPIPKTRRNLDPDDDVRSIILDESP